MNSAEALENGSNTDETTREALFPEALMAWAGHRDGGVRKPFRPESGRPAGGQRIETPLVKRLHGWVNRLVAGEPGTPNAILLVGGPGNGKTDAIETCIELLDAALDAGGALVNAFSAEFDVDDGKLPPRMAVVDLATLPLEVPGHMKRRVLLVQDASENAQGQEKSKEALLLDDLAGLLNPGNTDIYLCCVNRGILAQAATEAHVENDRGEVAMLFDRMTEATTCVPGAPACWPLDGFEHIAIWPMDVESIVDASDSGAEHTVAHQIFEIALDESRWPRDCPAGNRCPFCKNRKLLSNSPALDALIRLLRYYELASGKRWTFRDLFSLVSYLLVGEYSELEINGKPYSPCEWSVEQLKLAHSKKQDKINVALAPYLLASKLYYNRLFPTWPSLNTGNHFIAKRSVFPSQSLSPGLQNASNLFRFLASASRRQESLSGEVSMRVTGSMAPLLDPGLVAGEQVFAGGKYTALQIEEAFSLSVAEGLALTNSQLEPLDRDVLNLLALADEALAEEKFPSGKSRQVALLQGSIRHFSARLAKRSIGTRDGTCLDQQLFTSYEFAMKDNGRFRDIAKQLKLLLHDDQKQFAASLVTTFGQPVAKRSRATERRRRASTHTDLPPAGRGQ